MSSLDEIIEIIKSDDVSNVAINYQVKSHPKLSPLRSANTIFAQKKSKMKVQQTSLDKSLSMNSSESLTNSNDIVMQTSRPYRDKVRERFRIVKDRAESSLSRMQVNKLGPASDGNVHIRKNLELLRENNVSIDAEIKSKLLDRGTVSVSNVDRYNFFCEEIGITQLHDEPYEETNDRHNADRSTEDLLQASKLINPVHCRLPNLLEDHIQVAENDLFWQPTRISLRLQSKLEADEPRLLAEEGLYVPRVPTISYLNVLEQRLLSPDDKKWFNCDGNLKLIESPVCLTCYRPKKSFNYQLHTEYTLPTIEDKEDDNICTSVVTSSSNILEIDVVNIRFEHHPLFSAEHIFERRLLLLYDTYREANVHKNFERTATKLESLRKITLSYNLPRGGGDNNSDDKYLDEIKKLRELLFKEGREYRDNIKSILQTWKIIKKIRDKNQYSNTSVKLVIRKEKCNFERENQTWTEKINKVCLEIKREKQYDYTKKMIEYREKVNKWKDEELEFSTKPTKPSKDINEEDIREDVLKYFKQSFKPPGEPTLSLNITYDNEISKDVDDENEKLRRQAVKGTKIYVKILCNNINACKSKPILLNDTFTCFIEQTFSLQLSNIPNVLLLEIYEQSDTKHKISEISLRMPLRNVTNNKEKMLENSFRKEELIDYDHEGVGSGEKIFKKLAKYDITAVNNCIPHTSGSIRYYVGWEENGKTTSGVIDVSESQTILNEDGCIDVNKLAEWADTTQVDPQDPKNAILFEYLDSCRNKLPPATQSPKKYFRCGPNLQPLILYKSSALADNIRFKVLELRNNNEPEFIGMVVPNRIREIPSNVLSAYKTRIQEELKLTTLEDHYDKTLEEQRALGRKCLKEIYVKVFQQCRNAENNLEYEDIVNEKFVSYLQNWIKTFTANILNWFRLQPNISAPLPKFAKLDCSPEQATEFNVPVNVVVTVISALNIPKRTNLRRQSRSRTDVEVGSTRDVFSFIEVSCENMVLRTAVKDGVNPKWDEELIFQLQSTNIDYLSPNSLNSSIVVNLFEEFVNTITDKKLTTWLGYIQIPLSAICYSGNMEGYFRVTSPILNIQEHSAHKIQRNNNTLNTVHVSLKLRIEPKIPKLSIRMEEVPSSEPPYLQKYILDWNEKHNDNFPNRKFSAVAIDVNGKTLGLTRFIKPLEPPQMNENNFDVTPEQCARYISLIPFTDFNKFYDQVWLSAEQMLTFTIGSIIDHAIALTCYFLALNLDAWLLLGSGLPNGRTGYVLVRENGNENDISTYIYDVVSAIKYSTIESHCPLQKVYAVLNDTNIWANVQRTDEVNLTRFDFMNRSDWYPIFKSQMSAPSNSIQQKLTYNNSANDTQELDFQIEKKIRKTIAKQRKTRRTLWNHKISGVLKDIAGKSEYNYSLGKLDISAFIHGIEATHAINGFVIDLPYTNLSTITEIIQHSQISNVDIPEAEFVTAVRTHSYPNKVFVVWIIVGFVISK